jgi:predicted kinase
MAQPTLAIFCGLPGTGKTTKARELEERLPAVRFCVDDWMDQFSVTLWDEEARAKIEAVQWDLAKRLLTLGNNVVVEWGSWSRSERNILREFARSIGARVELHFLDASVDQLFSRISARGREDPPITRELIATWDQMIERPDAAELALYDEGGSAL